MKVGGARPGAGRKKGQKDKKPRKGTEARKELEKIQAMLAMQMKAKARFYQEFLIRVANQDGKQKPLALAEKKLMAQLAVELAEQTGEGKPEAAPDDLEAGDYLRKVWNDPAIDTALRIRAAEVALKGNEGPKGKKEEKADRAKNAGSGKFRPSAPPVLKVVKKL
jgi:hypothetical protein